MNGIMLKISLFATLLILSSNVIFAQDHYNRHVFSDLPAEVYNAIMTLGLDDDTLLTGSEGVYFNCLYNLTDSVFDMRFKKVAFLTGESGRRYSTKKNYFASEKNRFSFGLPPLPGALYIFDEQQSKETQFDAAIVYYSIIIPKKRCVIRTLKRHKK